MQRRGFVPILLAAGMAATMVCQAQSNAPNERGLWQVWGVSTNAADDHATVVAACREFRTKAPQDPLAVVAAGLEAWRLLEMGNTNEAVALFEAMVAVPEKPTYLQSAGAEMARGWLTRLDRETVRAALKKIYARDIEFPASLEPIKSLKIVPVPPLVDRWGTPWAYRLESAIQGLGNQQYAVESTRLGARSDLAKALALPYAGGITVEPIGLLAVSADTVEFATGGAKPAFLQAGGNINGVTFAYLGANLIVLADENHWRVALKPR